MGSALRINLTGPPSKGSDVDVTVHYSTGSGAAALQFLEKEYGEIVHNHRAHLNGSAGKRKGINFHTSSVNVNPSMPDQWRRFRVCSVDRMFRFDGI